MTKERYEEIPVETTLFYLDHGDGPTVEIFLKMHGRLVFDHFNDKDEVVVERVETLTNPDPYEHVALESIFETWDTAVRDAETLFAQREKQLLAQGSKKPPYDQAYIVAMRDFRYCHSARERLLAAEIRNDVRQKLQIKDTRTIPVAAP